MSDQKPKTPKRAERERVLAPQRAEPINAGEPVIGRVIAYMPELQAWEVTVLERTSLGLRESISLSYVRSAGFGSWATVPDR